MNEIKPTWKIAQQVSRQHSLISLAITGALVLGVVILAIIFLKCLGYHDSGKVLRQFYDAHRRIIMSGLFFIHLGPVNLYAVTRVLSRSFSHFQIKVFDKSNS